MYLSHALVVPLGGLDVRPAHEVAVSILIAVYPSLKSEVRESVGEGFG